MLRNPIKSFDQERFSICFNPPGERSCHFGCNISSSTLPLSGIFENRNGYLFGCQFCQFDNGYPIKEYLDKPFSVYISRMARNGAYSNEIILRAATKGSSLMVCTSTKVVHLYRWQNFNLLGGLYLIWFVSHFNTKYSDLSW